MKIQIVVGYNNKKMDEAAMFNGASVCPEDLQHPRDTIKWLHKLIRDIRAYDKKHGEDSQVSILTHSDYILKEINILYLLGQKYAKNPDAIIAFLKSKKYKEYTPDMFLTADEVIVTDTSSGKPMNVKCSKEYGWEFKSFDKVIKVINRMNSIEDAIQFNSWD